MKASRGWFWGAAMVALAGCGEAGPDESVQGTVQQLRAGHAKKDDGLYLSVDLLVTRNGQAVSCKDGKVSVTVETSSVGPTGPWKKVGGKTELRCRSEGD